MALIDHFAQDAGTESGGNGYERFPSHQFTDALYLWATGDINKNNVMNAFGLTTILDDPTDADELQLDQLAANYSTSGGAAAKLEYIHKVEAVLRLYEQGLLTNAQAKSFLTVT